MHELKQLCHGDHYFIIPEAWKDQLSTWKTLPEILEALILADSRIYIDLVYVEEIRGDTFAVLLNLAALAARERANLFFVGACEFLEERIALLANSAV